VKGSQESHAMRRIIVVGSPGSGKTSLSLELGRKLGLSVVHLDVLYWRPGWIESERHDFRRRVADVIAGDAWVVDGGFSGLAFDLTLARADTLIVIERPRLLCLWRVAWRSALERDAARPDLPPGCPEQFDSKLMREVWRYHADRRPRVEAERLQYGTGVPVVRLHSDREIAGFLDTVTPAT
jgi:adenylate kinase family enzyme